MNDFTMVFGAASKLVGASIGRGIDKDSDAEVPDRWISKAEMVTAGPFVNSECGTVLDDRR